MSDIVRDMTTAELVWWKSLKRVLRRQPATVELHARIGEVGIAPLGSRDEIFQRDGDADSFYEGEWDSLNVRDLDGRDSQL